MINWKYGLGLFGCVLVLGILPMSILWWQYAASGYDIIQLSGTITKIDTTFSTAPIFSIKLNIK